MTDSAICKEVIITSLTTRGDGNYQPFRRITQVFEKDGTLIAEHDPSPDVNNELTKAKMEEMINEKFSVMFLKYLERWVKGEVMVDEKTFAEWLKENGIDINDNKVARPNTNVSLL